MHPSGAGSNSPPLSSPPTLLPFTPTHSATASSDLTPVTRSTPVESAVATTLLATSDDEQKAPEERGTEVISSQAGFVGGMSESTSVEPLPAAPLSVANLGTSNPRRRRTYGQPRVSEDHKRERNRETFRRFYKRKQETLRELRDQEEQLAREYERLKLSHPEVALSASGSGSLVQLITQKDRVSAEQSVLQRVAQEQLRIRRQLGRLVDAFYDEDAEDHAKQFPLVQPSVDKDTTLHGAVGQLSAVQLSSELSRRDDAFGWQCWSQQQGEYVAFEVVKEFLAITLTPKQAARRTWEFYSESKSTGSLEPATSRVAPSSMVRMRRRVLSTTADSQHLTRLVFRRLTRVHAEPDVDSAHLNDANDDRPLRMTKSVYHVTLTPLASTEGFAVVAHSVPNQEIYEPVDTDILDALGDIEHPHTFATMFADESDLEILLGAAPREIHEEWIRELSWWRVEPSKSGVRVSFTGFAPVCLALTPCACFMEILRVAVQWENAVLGETPISCLDR